MKPSEKWIDNAAKAERMGQLSYQKWFDSATSLEAVRSQAALDFYHRIWTPDCYAELGCPFGLTAMEIGSGGGRLLANAASVFERAIGCDLVYDVGTCGAIRTQSYIASQGVDVMRFELLSPDALEYVPDGSVNFFYSFIAFQHMDDVETVLSYLRVIKRLSRDRNMSRIFCGRSDSVGPHVREASNDTTFDVTFKCSPEWFASNVRLLGGEIIRIDPKPPKRVWDQNVVSGQFMIDFRFQK